MRFNFVLVCPFVLLQISLIPANSNILAHSFSTHNPLPRGAGINVIRTEPHLPSTAKGIELGSAASDSQLPQPRRTRIKLRRAFCFALSLDGTVSLLFPTATPTYPSRFPTTAQVVNFILFPSDVFFCV